MNNYEIIWNLFKKTGDIRYFLLAKSIKKVKNMKIVDVKGLVLNETNYSDSSKILNVLTCEYGLIGILSKGCRNLKSKLRGSSRKLVYGTFHFYYKENSLSTLISIDVISDYPKTIMDLEELFTHHIC